MLRTSMLGSWMVWIALGSLCGCASGPPSATPTPPAVRWAIAIHAGAGVVDPGIDPTLREQYLESLRSALRTGQARLERGDRSIDVVEAVVRQLEDDPKFNAGKGAVFTHDGGHELDAAIMDGASLACGAVTGVRTVKNPIALARKVMTESRHVLFAGEGAERFADQVGVERVPPTYFDTPERYEAWQRRMAEERAAAPGVARPEATTKKGTVGAVALDVDGNLAAATSTGGLTNKRFGRVGDTPIIGAGTYANNRSCAVSCTGTGEEFIRHTVARDIAALVEYRGLSVEAAAREVVLGKLAPDDGGVIVLSRDGQVAFVFSTSGMFRGAADSNGRLEVAIWK
ncbi:MAG: isoaspartyl peptidase/L-asparaginase family protein [Planctomycetota bacterium]